MKQTDSFLSCHAVCCLAGLARDSGYAGEASPLPRSFARHIRFADYSCGAFKINCAVDKLPNFLCCPNTGDGNTPGPQHRGTIHFETRMEEIENAQREAAMGIPATRPVVEMTIPSSLDRTIAPPGKHVVQVCCYVVIFVMSCVLTAVYGVWCMVYGVWCMVVVVLCGSSSFNSLRTILTRRSEIGPIRRLYRVSPIAYFESWRNTLRASPHLFCIVM